LGAAWRHCECFLMKNPSSQTSVCIAAVASGAASIYPRWDGVWHELLSLKRRIGVA
jgi:hypothetical protein